jgi:hypothetical protein
MESQEPKKGLRVWWIHGLYWGISMFVLTILFDYLRYHTIETEDILRKFILWMVGGMLFGYLAKRFNWL